MKNDISNELKNKMEKIASYCEANKIPIFIACWEPPIQVEKTDVKTPTGRQKKVEIDDGYRYEYISPHRLRLSNENICGNRNRFPMLLGAIMGFDKDAYKL